MDIKEYIPKNKYDTEAVERALSLGFPALSPAIPDLLEWTKDMNWPVAVPVSSLLSTSDEEIVPHIKSVLNSEDSAWKLSVITLLVKSLRPDIAMQLRDSLSILVSNPTKEDEKECVDAAAKAALANLVD